MKRYITLLILLCTMCVSASAQWYLFPGKKKKNPVEKKPVAADTLLQQSRPDTAVWHLGAGVDSTTLLPDIQPAPDVFVLDIPSVIHIGLILPLQASEAEPNENFLDFYSGALLALRDLSTASPSLRADLQVFDSADSKMPLPQSLIDDNDVILGPVSFQDIESAMPLCADGKVLVSPLDPKAASLSESGAPVIQSPSTWKAQTDELVRWVREELPFGEVMYVVRDTAAAGFGAQSAYLIEQLIAHGIRYESVLNVGELPLLKDRKTRILIASDRDAFINSAVRAVSIEGARGSNVVLYGTSRIRTNSTAQADLHNSSAHLAASYFIDYDDPQVRDFILAYRALFRNEPGSFAFQGYDTMRYFVTLCAKYGRQWYKKLPDYSQKGLQADFRFTEQGGRVNQAVRRIVYNPDLTTSCE